jgi:hypothetical protein
MNGLFCSSYEKIRKAMGFNDWVFLYSYFIYYLLDKKFIYLYIIQQILIIGYSLFDYYLLFNKKIKK